MTSPTWLPASSTPTSYGSGGTEPSNLTISVSRTAAASPLTSCRRLVTLFTIRPRGVAPSRGAPVKLLRRSTLAIAAIAALVALPIDASPASAATGAPLPAHVYAPYFEPWTTDSIVQPAHQPG